VVVMNIVQEYRDNAAHCQQRADDHKDMVTRITWTNMAVNWSRLADDRFARLSLPPELPPFQARLR
jgi:hypothetical protein